MFCYIIEHIDNKAQFCFMKAGDDLPRLLLVVTPRHTKITHISQDICCVLAMNIECTMTIFAECYNVLNNKLG